MRAITKSSVEPLAVSIVDACTMIGVSRSEMYRLMGAGRVPAFKHGIRTLISTDALRAHLASLPAANIGRAPDREPSR